MSEHRPIGPVDAMWLNMDRPNNLMVIDSVMWFDETIDWERLGPLIQRRLVDRYPLFAQRPVASFIPFGTSRWEDDPDFDLSQHLRRVTLPAHGDQEALQRYVESRMSIPFDHTHPLWEVTLVEGYLSGCALVSRFHHSLADGLALSQVLLSLTNASPTVDLEELEAQGLSLQHPGRLVGAARVLRDTGTQTVRDGLHTISLIPELANPSRVMEVLELGWAAGKIADKLLLGRNPQTPFSGEPGVDKRAVWSGPRKIKEVKRVSRLTGATVNDVLVAAVSGAVNTYLRDHGADPVDLTTMIPVNVRPLDQPLSRELGNKFALVYLKLPTGGEATVGARGGEQATDGLHQGLSRGDHHVRSEHADRAHRAAPVEGHRHLLLEQGHRCDDQCHRTPAAALRRRSADHRCRQLGARFGPADSGSLYLQLCRHRARWLQGRCREAAGRREARSRLRQGHGPAAAYRRQGRMTGGVARRQVVARYTP